MGKALEVKSPPAVRCWSLAIVQPPDGCYLTSTHLVLPWCQTLFWELYNQSHLILIRTQGIIIIHILQMRELGPKIIQLATGRARIAAQDPSLLPGAVRVPADSDAVFRPRQLSGTV